MKHHLVSILIMALYSGLISGCASTPEKTLKTEGFTLSYKDKSSANKIRLAHPVNIPESDVRIHLDSLVYEELSLLGKKKYVFLPEDIDRIARLLTKALRHAPKNKIIHYELETSAGTTEGDIFASKDYIHWRFNLIKGKGFSLKSSAGWGNANWRLAPQSGQRYHETSSIMGSRDQKNWILAKLVPSKTKTRPRQKTKSKATAPSRTPAKETDLPAKSSNPVLEEKLQFLKDLHEKNLIDEKEYDQKRKELLDSYL